MIKIFDEIMINDTKWYRILCDLSISHKINAMESTHLYKQLGIFTTIDNYMYDIHEQLYTLLKLTDSDDDDE